MSESPWQDEEFARISLSSIDERFLEGTPREIDFLERELGLAPPARVLDLGCGAGRHAIEFARRGYTVLGLDLSSTMLDAAKRRASEASLNVDLRQMNLAELTPESIAVEPFDAATCLCMSGLGVLGGDAADFRFACTVRDLLASGGGFVVTGFNALRRYRSLNDRMDYITGVFRYEAPVDGRTLREDVRMYTPSEMQMLLRLAGYDDIRVYGCAPGRFEGQKLEVDDIEMMIMARKP